MNRWFLLWCPNHRSRGKSCFLLHLFNKLDMAAKHPDYPVYWQSNTAFDSWVCQFMRISFSIFSRHKDDLSALSCWQRTNEGSKITRLRTFVSHLICEGMQRLHGSLSKGSLTLKPRLKHVTNIVRRKIIYHNISLWPGLVRGLPWHWWVRSMTCKKVHSNHPTKVPVAHHYTAKHACRNIFETASHQQRAKNQKKGLFGRKPQLGSDHAK